MLWVFLSIISSLGDAFIFLFSKKLKNINYYYATWLKYTIALPFLSIYLLFTKIPKIDYIFIIAVILHSLIVFFASYLIFKATNISDLSKSIPMLSFTSIFLLGSAFFINDEIPNKFGIIGIVSIVLGAYILNIDFTKVSIFEPLKSIFSQKGSLLIIIVAFLYSLSASFAKLGISHSNGPFFSFSTYLIIAVFLSPIFFYKHDNNILDFKSNKNYLLLLGISSAIMILASNMAMERALVNYVIALKRMSILFSVLLGYYFFKEKNLKQNLFGAILMLLGVIIIVVYA